MNDKTVPNKCCPPSDSKSSLGLQTPDISELSHTGLLQCIRPHSDHSCDLDIWRRVFRPGSLMTQVLCSTLEGSSKWKSWKDLSLLPIYFPEVQGLQQSWSFLTQQASLHHPSTLLVTKFWELLQIPKIGKKKPTQGEISLVTEWKHEIIPLDLLLQQQYVIYQEEI